jgi:hypothetical protein
MKLETGCATPVTGRSARAPVGGGWRRDLVPRVDPVAPRRHRSLHPRRGARTRAQPSAHLPLPPPRAGADLGGGHKGSPPSRPGCPIASAVSKRGPGRRAQGRISENVGARVRAIRRGERQDADGWPGPRLMHAPRGRRREARDAAGRPRPERAVSIPEIRGEAPRTRWFPTFRPRSCSQVALCTILARHRPDAPGSGKDGHPARVWATWRGGSRGVTPAVTSGVADEEPTRRCLRSPVRFPRPGRRREACVKAYVGASRRSRRTHAVASHRS